MAAVVSNQGGYYSTFAYLSECRRMGLDVLLPDVNQSAIPWTGINRRVRVGFMQVQGLSVEAMEAIALARAEQGPFRSLEEFLRRVDLDPSDVRLLIKSGAFDSTAGGRSRPELMWQWVKWSAGRGTAHKGPARRASG